MSKKCGTDGGRVQLNITGPALDRLKQAWRDYVELSGHKLGLSDFAVSLYLAGLKDNEAANAAAMGAIELFDIPLSMGGANVH